MTIKTKNKLLWVVQAVLAILFMFAGITKLAADPVQLAADAHMSAGFLHFVSVCEMLGAVGLIIPAVTGIQPWLTPVAASGLIVIMIGAVVTTLMAPDQSPLVALFPLVVGVLLTVVVVGRRKVPPGSGSTPHDAAV
jgi:hypothetical protein